MFIKLNEYYYDLYARGYCTRQLAINIDEISDFHEYKLEDVGYVTVISLKTGKTYYVKEKYREIQEILEAITK